jgi:polar amino acid transport system substrate-binding protein
MKVRTALAAAGVLAAAALVATAAGAATSRPATAQDKLVFCSDTTYPPMEYLQGGKAVGADVDIANAIGKLLNVSVQIKTTGFDVIIPALLKKKCDAIISALTDTPDRRKQVDFANYVTVGMLLMVKKGNPAHVSGLASLSGKSVAVQAATTEKAKLDAQNKLFAKQGKKKVTIKIYPADTSAAAALDSGKVDAYFTDATPALYYIKQRPGKFEVAGKQIDSAPEGIATRKGDPLHAKFVQAIDRLYANGTMRRILAKWGLSAFALKR